MVDHPGYKTFVGNKDSDYCGLYSFIKCKLFKQYCCRLYGSNVWLLLGNVIFVLHDEVPPEIYRMFWYFI